jgi:GNAT superfamily N-acetyltransferase
MDQQIAIRAATRADAGTLVAHRRAMFVDMGHRNDLALDGMCAAFRPWLIERMDRGEYLAWVAIATDATIVAGIGLWLMDWLPHLTGAGAPRGNIVNVYTDPASRRRGIARKLVEVALEWCRMHGIRTVILHASDAGRPLYEKLGFQPTNEMRLTLEVNP